MLMIVSQPFDLISSKNAPFQSFWFPGGNHSPLAYDIWQSNRFKEVVESAKLTGLAFAKPY
jgi:hypothetical protein